MPSASQALVEFFTRALARKPQQRFASTTEMATALAAALGERAPTAQPVAPVAPANVAPANVAPAAVPVAPRARGPMLIAAAAILAVGGVVIAYVATRPSPPSPPSVVATVAVPVVAIDAAAPVVASDAAAPVVAIDAATARVAPTDAVARVVASDAAAPVVASDAAASLDAAPPSASNREPGTGNPESRTRCATGCEQLALCDLADPTCAADCAQHADVAKCLADSIGSCDRSAACVFLIRAIKRPAAPAAR